MNKLSIALVVAGLFTIAGAAEAKGRKPVVCEEWVKYTSQDKPGAVLVVCWDNADKPFIVNEATFVDIKNKDGEKVRAAIGWR